MPFADPDQAQAYNREYKRANRWRYRRRQKFYDAAKHANERAAKYGRPGTITPEDVEAILDGAECAYCGTADRLTVDHVIPLHLPDSVNAASNIVACCLSCNLRKRRKPSPEAWSDDYDQCQDCGTSDRPHAAKGLCLPCYNRRRPRAAEGAEAA